ncbi:hypothetical protein LCGC14_2343730 [marine sediment metagenome]|uniref:Uncharacterized protein n=1 Tax=marine sediment metagenome TaxID=412755 RepID=A0A0F9ENW7_9ZZZZ
MTPGRKATEFWALIAYIAAFVANGSDYITIPWDQYTVLAGLVASYVFGRSYVKAAVAKNGATV